MNLSGAFKTLNIHIGNINFTPQLWQAGIVLVLIFALILVTAQMRRHYFGWSMKGAWFGVVIGFALALILEGFLLVSGKTALTVLLGWKNAPEPIQNALDVGHTKLVDVLSATDSATPCKK